MVALLNKTQSSRQIDILEQEEKNLRPSASQEVIDAAVMIRTADGKYEIGMDKELLVTSYVWGRHRKQRQRENNNYLKRDRVTSQMKSYLRGLKELQNYGKLIDMREVRENCIKLGYMELNPKDNSKIMITEEGKNFGLVAFLVFLSKEFEPLRKEIDNWKLFLFGAIGGGFIGLIIYLLSLIR